jgi:hypothetical protein
MLIDLGKYGPLTIDPAEYLTTLAIRLSVGGEASGFTGIMQGRHDPFLDHERNQPVPIHVNEDDEILPGGPMPYNAVYLIDRPPFEGQRHMSYRWYYAATGWDGGVYVGHSYAYEVTLMCCSREPDGEFSWSVSLEGDRSRFTLILPDYQPGFRLRNVGPTHEGG